MSPWLFALLIVLAFAVCPLTMWVTSKVTRRKMSCEMWGTGTVKRSASQADLEARKFELEKEMALVKEEQRLAALRLNDGVEGPPQLVQGARDEATRNN